MDSISIFKDLAIIIIMAKVFGIIARKLKAPQVVGEIVAGLIIGPCLLGWVQQTDFLAQMAEIGVILLMFSAGLDTDLRELLKTGPIATLIACAGVFVPLVCGTILYMCFFGFSPIGSEEFYRAVFIGTTIMSAAIIDDIIGIIVLTIVIGFKDPSSNPGKVVINTVLFFAFAIVVGYICYRVFRYLDKRWPHTRRIPIMSLALCFIMVYIAEHFFGIADITGAYFAGIILCSIGDSNYIARKMDINS